MRLIKPKFWDKNYLSIFSLLLFPISILIKLLSYLKKKIVTPTKFNLPIICIGNIYVGGTGKTPLSIKVYNIITQLKRKPVIIKKFYKDQLDEIKLIENKTKNIITRKLRKNAINYAIEKKILLM